MTDTLERQGRVPPKSGGRKRSAWGTMLFLALLVALGLVASGVLPIQQYFDRENAVNEAEARLSTLKQQNAHLAEESAALLTEQEVERIAREQYGFVRPGETGYVVTTPEGTGQADPQPVQPVEPAEPETADDRGFLQRVWDFITGNDIADDG